MFTTLALSLPSLDTAHLLAMGVGLLVGFLIRHGYAAIIASKVDEALEPVDVHTGHPLLDSALDTLGNTVESVLKDIITGPLIETVLNAYASGGTAAVEAALMSTLPTILASVESHLGVLGDGVKALLGDLFATKVAQMAAAKAPAIAESAKVLGKAPSGRALVSVAPVQG